MLPYYCLYVLIIGACFLLNAHLEANRLKRLLIGSKIEDWTFYLLSIIVALFIATRLESVGRDTIPYVKFFNNPDFLYIGEKTDPMFELFGRIIHFIVDSKEFFIFITGIFSFYGIYWLIQKTSYNRVLSLTIFCIVGVSNLFLMYMCIIRQVTAITFYIIGTYLLFEKYSKFHDRKTLIMIIICYTLASLTHLSCMFTFPFVAFIYYTKGLNIRYWITIIGITYILAALNHSYTLDIFKFIFNFFDDDHYGKYSSIKWGMIDEKGWFNMRLIPSIIMSIMIMLTKDEKKLTQWYCQFFFISVALNNLFFDNIMWNRLNLYFTIFVFIAVPNTLYNKSTWYRLGCYSLIFCYFIYSTFAQLSYIQNHPKIGNVVPYESWLFHL